MVDLIGRDDAASTRVVTTRARAEWIMSFTTVRCSTSVSRSFVRSDARARDGAWMDGWMDRDRIERGRMDDGWMTRGVDAWWRREGEDA